MIRILLIGPLPPPMGGDTRHFQTLFEDLNTSEKFQVRLVNTSRGSAHSSLLQNMAVALKAIWAMLVNAKNVDVISYHASDRGMFLFGPVAVVLSAFSRTPTIFRLFGGSFGDFYEDRSNIGKWIIRKFILSSDFVLLQTRRSIDQLRDKAVGKLVWFSTYIKATASLPPRGFEGAAIEGEPCSRFVYLGHLWKNKGVDTILEAAHRLPDGCSIDLYGPLDEYTADEIRDRGLGRIRYLGFLTHEQVDTRLWEYDCLVLPTYHPGEGYPGVIAEAFAHGLPVITTRWLAIPEIVDDDCGMLIEPRDSGAFAAAITTLHQNRARYLQLKEGARAKAGQFDHSFWSRKFEELCENLVRK